MFQNETKLKNCIKIFSIDEFSEFEGLWENSCIAECYFNETGINTPSGVNVSQFKTNPYLSTEDIEKCVEGGECEGYFSCTIDLSPNYLSQPLLGALQQTNTFLLPQLSTTWTQS